jgi:hypothetical protein
VRPPWHVPFLFRTLLLKPSSAVILPTVASSAPCRGLQASLESVSAELASEQRAAQEAREAAASREERLRTVLLRLSEAEDEARAQRRQADAAREVAANLTEKVTSCLGCSPHSGTLFLRTEVRRQLE